MRSQAAPQRGLATAICYPLGTPIMDYSPYAPPQQQNPNAWGGGGGYLQQYVYKPLGWRTTATIVGIIGTVVFGFVQTGATLAFGDVLRNPSPQNLGVILVLGLLGLVTSGVSIATWVLFLVWTNLAAKNVRAFGQQGLEYTPGWCVGWWFIPIASLWKPFSAMREIWKASDPDSVGPNASKSWMSSVVPATMPVWWGVYILNGFVAMGVTLANLDFSGSKATVTPGPSSFLSHGMLGIAGVLLIVVMRQLAQRQEAAWQRLQSAPANPPGPPAYGQDGGYGGGGAYGADGGPGAAGSTNPYL